MSSRCPRCDRVMVEITITLEGEDVTMQSCSACDHRAWAREGEAIEIDGVLGDLGLDRPDPAQG